MEVLAKRAISPRVSGIPGTPFVSILLATYKYLMKGIIRCAYCGMPMWAQTYNSGRSYYREHTGSRSHAVCPAEGASLPCHVPDEQMGRIVGAIELGPKWLEEVLAIISLKDEVGEGKERAAGGSGKAAPDG